MRAELISVGTELLLGEIVNTNTKYLSEKMALLGVNVFHHSAVGDNRERIIQTLDTAAKRAEIMIITGGLGPTGDDLTKEALADYLQLPLEMNELEAAKIKDFFQRRGLLCCENNLKQAFFIPQSTILPNDLGTAPGMIYQDKGKSYILLPGPPKEMQHMFQVYVIPWLNEKVIPSGTLGLYSHVLKFLGISESQLEVSLQDLFDQQQTPTLALLAQAGYIHLRLTARAQNKEDFQTIIEPLVQEIYQRVGKYLVATDEMTLVETLAEMLKKRNLTISTAESCTGGLFSSYLTSVPGASQYYLGSIIAYSNELKTKLLAIPAEIITLHGAVSEEVALMMAKNVRELTQSDLGIGITGIAGPDGGTAQKPVGLVYVALDTDKVKECSAVYFKGDRDTIRQRAVFIAENLLRKYLKDEIK